MLKIFKITSAFSQWFQKEKEKKEPKEHFKSRWFKKDLYYSDREKEEKGERDVDFKIYNR